MKIPRDSGDARRIRARFGRRHRFGDGPGPGWRPPRSGLAKWPGPADDRELIGHALSMAIESSGLMLTAQQGGYGRGYDGPGGTSRGTTAGGGASDSLGTSRGATAAPREPAAARAPREPPGAGTMRVRGRGRRALGDRVRGPGVVRLREPESGGRLEWRGRVRCRGQRGWRRDRPGGMSGLLCGQRRNPGCGLHCPERARKRPDQPDARLTPRPGGPPGPPGGGQRGFTTATHARRGFEDSERLFREAARRAGDGIRRRDVTSPRPGIMPIPWSLLSVGAAAGQAGAGTGGAVGPVPRPIRRRGIGPGYVGLSDMQWVCLAASRGEGSARRVQDQDDVPPDGDQAEATETLRQHAQQMHTEGTRLSSRWRRPPGRRHVANRPPPGRASSLLDAATARTRDRDVRPASGARAAPVAPTSARTGAGEARTGAAGLGASDARGGMTITLAQQIRKA